MFFVIAFVWEITTLEHILILLIIYIVSSYKKTTERFLKMVIFSIIMSINITNNDATL